MTIELPFSLGDELYEVCFDKYYNHGTIVAGILTTIHIGYNTKGKYEEYIRIRDTFTGYLSGKIPIYEIDKNVFRTRKEAELEIKARIISERTDNN